MLNLDYNGILKEDQIEKLNKYKINSLEDVYSRERRRKGQLATILEIQQTEAEEILKNIEDVIPDEFKERAAQPSKKRKRGARVPDNYFNK